MNTEISINSINICEPETTDSEMWSTALDDHFESEEKPWEASLRKGNDLKVLESDNLVNWNITVPLNHD